MTLTVDGLRGFVESSLGDDELGLLLDAAYEAIDREIGSAGYDGQPLTELLTTGPGDLLMLSRPANAITTLLECDAELAQDDYELIGDQLVRRLATGTHPSSRWRGRAQITYELMADTNERDRVAIALVKLDLNNEPGVIAERLGDHSITFASDAAASYAAERAAILSSLASGFIAK